MSCYANVAALVLAVASVSCKGGNPLTGSSIEYRVSGTAVRGSITYQNSSGGSSQTSDTVLPWSYSLTASRDDFLYVSVQNSAREGCVRAEIYRGDRVLESGFSCGAFVIATASASAP